MQSYLARAARFSDTIARPKRPIMTAKGDKARMNPSTVITRSLATLMSCLLFMGITCQQLHAAQPGSDDKSSAGGNIKLGKKSIKFFDAMLYQSESKENDRTPYITQITMNKKTVYTIKDNAIAMESASVINNFPANGMTTLAMSHFSGGAHCCLSEYWLTRDSNGRLTITQILLGNSDESLITNEKKTPPFTVIDGGLAYYSVKSGRTEFSLSYVESPQFVRHIMYGATGWRVDRPGEFSADYKLRAERQKKEKIARGDMNGQTASAMIVAYYELMSGENEKAAFEKFKKMLPRDTAPLAEAIFADVAKQVNKFNPLETTVLR